MARQFTAASHQYLSGSYTDNRGAWSLSQWIYKDSSANAHSYQNYDAGFTQQNGKNIIHQTDDDILVSVTTTGNVCYRETTTGDFTSGSWHHLLATFTGDVTSGANFKVYHNGSEVGGYGGSGNGTGNELTSAAVGIGARIHVGDRYFNGRIAETAEWGVVLDGTEIAALATGLSPIAIRPQSLRAYWRLIRDDDIDVIGAYDLSGTNNPTVGSHAPVIYLGFVGLGVAKPITEIRRPRNPAHYNELFIY